jgi:Zn-finger nucleic acid-binding protein
MKISDDAWIAAARERVAHGHDWATPPEEVSGANPAPRAAAPQARLLCPYCKEHPTLTDLHRYETASTEPLWYCPACYGVWATDASLAGGVADESNESPVLYAERAAPRCRSCAGHLDEHETCRKCGKTLPRLNCPLCGREMARSAQKGVTLDHCTACRGTWFDTGEIAAVFGLTPPRSLAAHYVDQLPKDDRPEWLIALDVLLRMFLPFIF